MMMHRISRLFAVAVLAMLTQVARADLQVGQAAPDFALPDQNGKVQRLSDYRGKVVVLAFYPKDFTAG